MKYLCLAYGSEKDWKALTESEQTALLAQDDALRERGDLVAAVGLEVTAVRSWNGTSVTSEGSLANSRLPLAGFGIIEAADMNEAVQLVAHTPCARAKGVVEVRPITVMNGAHFEEEQ
jgi:hypothetical protein